MSKIEVKNTLFKAVGLGVKTIQITSVFWMNYWFKMRLTFKEYFKALNQIFNMAQHQQPESLGGALITTVAADNLTDAGTSILDAALGVYEEVGSTMLASTEVLQHIPVVGVMFKLYKAGAAITQQVFARKLAIFLDALGSVPLEKRLAFVDEFNRDLVFRQKVGDNLILILDKSDNIDKAELLGKLFALYVIGTLDYNAYIRLASIVNKAHFPDLISLRKSVYEEGVCEPEFSEIEIEGLSVAGIVREVMTANNHPFPYEGPTNPPSPDRVFAYFTLIGGQLTKMIKQLY